jgi:hypothetical protein
MIPLNVMLAIEEIHCAKEVHVGAKSALSTCSAMLMVHDD